MSRKEMKNKIRWVNKEVWLKGNLDAMDEIYDAGRVLHSPPLPDISGLEAVKVQIAGIRSAYSDTKMTYREMIGFGLSAAVGCSTPSGVTVSPSLPCVRGYHPCA